MKYAQHVAELLKTHKLRVEWLDKGDSYLDVGVFTGKKLLLLPVTNARTYAMALHEIGHVVSGTLSQPVLWKEAEAWAWAKQHAFRWTKSMQTCLRVSLRSYVVRALADYEQAKPAQMLVPAKDHVFWTLVEEIPQAQKLLSSGSAPWLAKHLAVIPWGNVMGHPQRPRCESCFFWQRAVAFDGGPKNKRDWGMCRHKATPLGTEMTLSGSLCADSWMS